MKRSLLLLVAFALMGAIMVLEPISQDEAYHRFADSRHLLGIPNFWNVVSNVLFAYVGIAGLRFLAVAGQPGIVASLLPSYRVFFSGLLLTAFGSAWYHAAPGIESMVWDRLPMTIAFMSLFSLVIGEQLSERLGRQLLLPLLLVGAGTVVYWWFGESAGRGDLRPYVLVQFMPMILIPMMLALYQSPFDRTGFIWLMIVLYAAAKVF
ncbi:MAG: ceramidase domain-containing protein, partial [Woeseiaceae bacterium]